MIVKELIQRLLLHSIDKKVLVANHTHGDYVIHTTTIAYVSESDDSVTIDVYFEPIEDLKKNPDRKC